MNLKIVNADAAEYSLTEWTNDLSGLKFRNTYQDRFGKSGVQKQGDGQESSRTFSVSYALTAETDTTYIAGADALYAVIRPDLAPLYIHDTDNSRRLAVALNDLDLNPKPGTEMRFTAATMRFTALDTFWESLTDITVDPGSAAVENQETVACNNPGVVTVYPVITIEPTESNPNFTLYNETTDDLITIGSNSFVPGTSLIIDCRVGSVTLVSGSTNTEISSAIADGTGYLHFIPGVNTLRYDSAYGPVTLSVAYRRRWPF